MAHGLTTMDNIRRFGITIPANSGNGSNLLALLVAAGYDGPATCIVKICKKQANSTTDRAAFVAASLRHANGVPAAYAAADFTTHGQTCPAGEEYSEPVASDAQNTLVRSTDASTVPCVVVVVF